MEVWSDKWKPGHDFNLDDKYEAAPAGTKDEVERLEKENERLKALVRKGFSLLVIESSDTWFFHGTAKWRNDRNDFLERASKAILEG